MKSIRFKILAWSFAILLFTLIALAGFALFLDYSNVGPGDFFRSLGETLAEEAEWRYASGGKDSLREFLRGFEARMQAHAYLLDASGTDLLTGKDESHLLRLAGNTRGRPIRHNGEALVVVETTKGNVFAVRRAPPFDPVKQLPYFLLILVAMGIFCWILAVDIAAPLKTMAEGMTRFGAGDLSARLGVKRSDEIGRLSQSFDAMADRIQLLLHAERRLLQDISHELRSPLARLSVAGQLIKREDKRVEATAQIERETERLGVLIGDLVAVTRAEGDPAASRRELVRLDLLVEEIVENCAMEADMKNCRIAVLNEVGELELQGVQELLWRAIENVLRNAILHSPPRGIVEVTLTRRGDREAQVSIRDSGPGVPPQQLDDIFQPFYRIDESRNAKTGGVGLGLAIAQRAINLHHGEIVAENADPGLRVQIRLPI